MIRIRLEVLELRDVPANWPLDGDVNKSIISTYGQFTEHGGIHFHEGVDFRTAKDTVVLPIESGKVSYIYQSNDNKYYNQVGMSAGEFGYNFIHIEPAVGLAVNDELQTNHKLGKVVESIAPQAFATHLHVDWGKGIDPFVAQFGKDAEHKKTYQPWGDVLVKVSTLNQDSVRPTVSDVNFRVAQHDRLGVTVANVAGFDETPRTDNDYFRDEVTFRGETTKRRKVGFRTSATNSIGGSDVEVLDRSEVDIIANAYDYYGNPTSALDKVGVQRIRFRIQKDDADLGARADTEYVESFRFVGRFLELEGVQEHHYGTLRNTSLTRVVYEHDAESLSKHGNAYWYIVTNTDVVPPIGRATAL